MNFALNVKAFLSSLSLSQMNGAEKFLAVAAALASGNRDHQQQVANLRAVWRKTILGVRYNPSFYLRAQRQGWIDPQSARGTFVVTQDGLDHLAALDNSDNHTTGGTLRKAGGLIVVSRKGTHSFDKFLRGVLSEAKREVLIADAWVDETIFDNALDVVPKNIPFKLIYAESRGTFDQRANRFATEFSLFQFRRYKPLHDRFIVVDEQGLMLGPSIKDAASHSPALVVKMGPKEQRLLRTFFGELWEAAKRAGGTP